MTQLKAFPRSLTFTPLLNSVSVSVAGKEPRMLGGQILSWSHRQRYIWVGKQNRNLGGKTFALTENKISSSGKQNQTDHCHDISRNPTSHLRPAWVL